MSFPSDSGGNAHFIFEGVTSRGTQAVTELKPPASELDGTKNRIGVAPCASFVALARRAGMDYGTHDEITVG